MNAFGEVDHDFIEALLSYHHIRTMQGQSINNWKQRLNHKSCQRQITSPTRCLYCPIVNKHVLQHAD